MRSARSAALTPATARVMAGAASSAGAAALAAALDHTHAGSAGGRFSAESAPAARSSACAWKSCCCAPASGAVRSLASAAGANTTGASARDQLGLPKGTLLYADSVKVASATAARAGDTFQIRTGEAGRLATVTFEASDTLDTLAAKVRRAAGSKAKVEVVSDGDFRRLKITPATKASSVEILPGKGGTDALGAIGLTPGVVRNTIIDSTGKSVSADGGGPVFGLSLPAALDVDTDLAVKHALTVLGQSMSKIRDAYRQLETAAKPASTIKPGASGPVPAYLTNQISNYTAALNRLTGGG